MPTLSPSTVLLLNHAPQQCHSQSCTKYYNIFQVDTHSTNLNYGALTCLSCRAFFRRIIQQKLKQELKCRGDGSGNCSITPENRKKCKRCRFEQCLRSGMRPDAVLNETQYQRRFRKMISKQQEQLIQTQVSELQASC